MRNRIIRTIGAVALGVALMVGGAATANAKENTPGHIKNGKFVPGCSDVELTTESGGSDIVGGSNVTYVAPANGGTGTFDFTFQLGGKSCTQLDYRIDVYQYTRGGFVTNADTPIAVSHTSGTFTSTSLVATTVVIPAGYTAEDPCISVIVRSMNGTTQLDQAPDVVANDVCAGEGGSQLWR